jgi:hypothetical protein
MSHSGILPRIIPSIFSLESPWMGTPHLVLVHLAISLSPRSPRLASLRMMQQTARLRSYKLAQHAVVPIRVRSQVHYAIHRHIIQSLSPWYGGNDYAALQAKATSGACPVAAWVCSKVNVRQEIIGRGPGLHRVQALPLLPTSVLSEPVLPVRLR